MFLSFIELYFNYVVSFFFACVFNWEGKVEEETLVIIFSMHCLLNKKISIYMISSYF